MTPTTVILAAGKSTRMKSKQPKILHPIAGKPMITYLLDTVKELREAKPIVVIGHCASQVRQALGQTVTCVHQRQQLGTGHALLQTQPLLEGQTDTMLVLYGDMPLLTTGTLRRLLARHQQVNAAITMLTVQADDPMGFGRILRDLSGQLVGIVEEAVATEEEKRICELNCGVYCFHAPWLWPHLTRLPLSPKGEYYLTDLIAMAIREGAAVETITTPDSTEVLGINDRLQLARAEATIRQRIREHHLAHGVTIVDPPSTFIDATAAIAADTTIHPHTFIYGHTAIGPDCHIGPHTFIRDTTIGPGCRIFYSVLEEATLEDQVDVGPFAHLRQGAHLATGVHLGNFGEVKNAYLGPGTKMGHFGYLGDASIGRQVNIGAGTITCNYDGQQKHPTTIEDHAFIGSDTMLVAPVRIGAGAKTGAGSVVTRDVPPGHLAYGVPARVKDTTQPAKTEDTPSTLPISPPQEGDCPQPPIHGTEESRFKRS